MNLNSVATVSARTAIESWLQPLEHLQLECDGLTRVIAMLLTRASIKHTVFMGKLQDNNRPPYSGDFSILHFWISLSDGAVIDFRARAWFGSDAPHGVFMPADYKRFEYCKRVPQGNFSLPINLLSAMAEIDLSAFPSPPIDALFHFECVDNVQAYCTVH